MCDQTEVQYLPGEVVWVKLRALWWPGLVQDYDSLPEDITCSLRKRPIATVKFFQEDSYEYVHKLDLIYHYNCSRKHEFIKKGLDLCRKKTADRPATMDFFPADVVTAEELTNGDLNILQNETFKPEEKPKYTSLFGSEKKKLGKKKGKEDSPLKDKSARRKKLTSKLEGMGWLSRGVTANIIYPSPDTPRIVTHRRFLNKSRNPDAKSDYEVRIMEQKCEDEPSCLSDQKYHCVLCGYITRRLNVIVLHFNSTHSRKMKNIFPTPSLLKGGSLRTSLLKLKGESRKSLTGGLLSKKRTSIKGKVEKIKREENEADLLVNEVANTPPVKKEKGRPGRKRKVKPEEKEQDEIEEAVKKPKVLDSLLADWDEDAEQEDNEMEGESKLLGGEDDDDEDFDDDGTVSNDNESANADKSSVGGDASTSKSKEVFEFDPDEDDSMDLDLAPNKGFGRRIPRVINSSKDKRGKGSSSDSKKSGKSKDKIEKEDVNEFESLLAETSVPSVPSVPKSSTFSQDLDDSGPKAILKEQNDAENLIGLQEKGEEPKNSDPEVDLAVGPKSPPQGLKNKSTAKVTVEKIPDLAVVGTDIRKDDEIFSLKNESKSEKPTGGGDHTYTSGNSGRRRRRSLLPLEKSDGTLDIHSMSDDNDIIEESPRVNKQPFLPQIEGSPAPRRVGRPPKRSRGRPPKNRKIAVKEGPMSSPLCGSKSLSPFQSPKSLSSHQTSKIPALHSSSKNSPSPKSPPPEQSPKSPDQIHKSPTHGHSSKSPSAQRSPKRPAQQSMKSPVRSPPMSPIASRGPKSPSSPQSPKSPQPYQSPTHQGPKSPQPYQSPTYQGPKSPQGLQSPRSPTMSSPTLLSPKSSASASVLKSPPQSPGRASGDAQSASVISGSKSLVKSPGSQTLLFSPTKTISKVQPAGSCLTKATVGLRKVTTSGAVVVQSKPDLQPEACGIARTLSLSPSSAPSSSGGTVKTIKVAVSGAAGSSTVMSKTGTPSGTPRKVMIVQGKDGTQKMLLPTGASQQLLNNIGSGKKIIVMTKGSGGSPGKLVLTSQQQKILASGGKVTTSSGQVLSSKGTMLSSLSKLVSSKASTSGTNPSVSGVEFSSEPPALVKTEGKKTYKIITSPQSKGNILLNTSGGQILLPVSSISGSGSGVTTSTGSKQLILPSKLLNAVGGSGQKVILQMKSSPAKAVPGSPKTVQPIVSKSIQSITPKTVQTLSPKAAQHPTAKTVQITSKTVQAITPKAGQPLTPKTSQPMKVTTIATMIQPVPQLTPIGSPKPGSGRAKQIKPIVAKSATQPKVARKIGPSEAVATPSSNATIVASGVNTLKKNSGIIPNPNLKTIVPQPQVKPTKKISLASKPAPVETASVSSLAGTMQVVTGAVPGLEQIQTSLVPSVETSSTVALPTSTQQLVTIPTGDGQVMYLIDNSSLIGLDGSNQANLGNIIFTFDNMGQPVSSASSDLTSFTPSSGQDILAEAMANTQLLPSEVPGGELSLDSTGLLSTHPSTSVYQPTLSHGVLETSLTLNQPIMTPLEDLSAVSTLQPPPVSGAITSVDLPSTITVPDITISTSSYAHSIPSATIQNTVFSEAQNITTFSSASADGSVFIEAPVVEGDSFLTDDGVYEQSSEGASMPLLDG